MTPPDLPPIRSPLSAAERALLFALLAAIAALHLGTLAHRSLWNDEFITLNSLDLSYRGIVRERLHANHSPGYFLMLKAWTGLAGTGEKALHFPSALGVLLGIALVWRTAARLWGERWAMLALALAGFNQMLLQEGNDARMYGLLFCAAAMTFWSFARWLDEGRPRDLAFLLGAGVFGLGLHLLYLLTTAVLAMFILKRRRELGSGWRRPLLAVLAPLVLLAPLLIAWSLFQRKVGQARGWQRFELIDAFRQVIILFTGDHRALGSNPVQYLGIALSIGILALAAPALWRKSQGKTGTGFELAAEPSPPKNVTGQFVSCPRFPAPLAVELALLWCLVPAIAIALASLRSSGTLNLPRYFIALGAATPLLATAAAVRLAALKGRRTALLAAALFLCVVIAHSAGHLAAPGSGLREVAQHIGKDWKPGDALIVSKHRNRTRAFVYYGPLAAEPPELPDAIDADDAIAQWALQTAQGHARLWVVFYDPPKKDALARALDKKRTLFEPLEKGFIYGETSVALFRPNSKEPLVPAPLLSNGKDSR